MPIPIQPQTLGDIYGMNPGAFAQAQRQIGLGMQQEQASLQDMYLKNQGQQQTNAYNQQANPLKLRGLGLEADTAEARLPGIRADSAMRGRENDVDASIPIDVKKKAHLSKIMTEMSEDKWKQTTAAIKVLMTSEKTEEQKLGKALFLLTPEVQKARLESADALAKERELIKLRAQELRLTNAAKPVRSTGVNQLEKALVSGNPNQVAAAYDKMAQDEDDPQDRAFYLQKAREYREIARQQDINRNPGTAPGRPNLGGMGIPTNPTAPPVQPPLTRGGAPSTPPATNFSAQDQQALEWANANPKDPRAKRIKDKLGVK